MGCAAEGHSCLRQDFRLVTEPLAPMDYEEDDWPSMEDILTTQRAATVPVPDGCTFGENGLAQFPGDVVWIPDEDKLMQLRLLIAAHAGPGGHRGICSTTVAMKNFVCWRSIDKDVNSFMSSCLHCLSTTTASTIPRPMAQTLHAPKPNLLLHFDYLFIGNGLGGNYILVLKDDFSSYVRLFLAWAADAETTARALTDWFSTFGVCRDWVSDRGSHFKNEVVRILKEQNRCAHRFTLAYSP
jgi:hypothetical protein